MVLLNGDLGVKPKETAYKATRGGYSELANDLMKLFLEARNSDHDANLPACIQGVLDEHANERMHNLANESLKTTDPEGGIHAAAEEISDFIVSCDGSDGYCPAHLERIIAKHCVCRDLHENSLLAAALAAKDRHQGLMDAAYQLERKTELIGILQQRAGEASSHAENRAEVIDQRDAEIGRLQEELAKAALRIMDFRVATHPMIQNPVKQVKQHKPGKWISGYLASEAHQKIIDAYKASNP